VVRVSADGAILVRMAPSLTNVSARAPGQSREITPVTRRDIFDFLRADAGSWWGRLGELDFLDLLYDLDVLPSTDPRHATAEEDIARHRIANLGWDDDWARTAMPWLRA
jgi:AbiJ N-terminal domain 3